MEQRKTELANFLAKQKFSPTPTHFLSNFLAKQTSNSNSKSLPLTEGSRAMAAPGSHTRVSSFTFLLIFSLLLLNSETVNSIENPIKTVVVLVMENRSFDHMLGWMKKLNPEINGVDGSESNPLSVTDPNSQQFFFKDTAHYVDPDPGHSFQAIREQIFGSDNTSADPAPMIGFAQQAYSMDNTTNMTQNVMNGFEPDKVAVYKALVSEFAVFDRSDFLSPHSSFKLALRQFSCSGSFYFRENILSNLTKNI